LLRLFCRGSLWTFLAAKSEEIKAIYTHTWRVRSLAVLSSIASMVFSIRYMRRGPIQEGETLRWYLYAAYRAGTVIYSVGCFLGGIVLFLYFATLNF
jgi:hypothetical protein